HPDTLAALHVRAVLLRRAGRLSEAESYARQAVAMGRANLEWGPSEGAVNSEWFLALILQDVGKTDEAISTLRDFGAWVRVRLPENVTCKEDLQVCCLDVLSEALLKRASNADVAEAEANMRHALTLCEHEAAPGRVREWLRYNSMSLLGQALAGQRRFADA